MSGPRDPSEHEAGCYRDAVEMRDSDRLIELVRDMYPNVLWGSVTQSLPAHDREWINDTLTKLERDRDAARRSHIENWADTGGGE